MAADNVSVLVAEVFLVSVPIPVMIPERVWSADDANTSAALFVIPAM